MDYMQMKNNLWTAVRGGFEVFDLKKKTFRFVPLINNSWLLKNPAQIFQEKEEIGITAPEINSFVLIPNRIILKRNFQKYILAILAYSINQ